MNATADTPAETVEDQLPDKGAVAEIPDDPTEDISDADTELRTENAGRRGRPRKR